MTPSPPGRADDPEPIRGDDRLTPTTGPSVATTGGDVIRQVLLRDRRRLVGAALLLTAYQTGETLVPVAFGAVIDRAVGTGDGSALVTWIGALVGVFLVLSVSYRFGARWSSRLALDATHALRLRLVDRVLHPRAGAELPHPGTLVAIATTDSQRVGDLVPVVTSAVGAVIALLVAAAVLLMASVPLGLVVIIGAPPVLLLLQRIASGIERGSAQEQETAAQAAAVAIDLVTGLRVLKGIGGERVAVDRYRATSQRSLAASLAAARARAWHVNVTALVTGLFMVTIAALGAWFALRGELSVGGLIAVIGLAGIVLDPLGQVASVGADLARARASATRVAGVLSRPMALSSGSASTPPEARGLIECVGVTGPGLLPLDLVLGPGELVGIAVDGAAAATLLELLGRRADPTTGVVRLDGRPMVDMDPDAVRRTVLTLAHDDVLFEGTLEDDLALPGTDPASLDAALAAAAADELVARLPDGLRTRLAERGTSLSGGERQRVALARVLVRDPLVLVLHEPTTAVDAVTEARIADGLRRVRRGRTTVVITTSPTLLAACDRVVEAGA